MSRLKVHKKFLRGNQSVKYENKEYKNSANGAKLTILFKDYMRGQCKNLNIETLFSGDR